MPRLEIRHERWERPDGDFIDLGHCGTGNGPRTILLHGLTGGFDSKYLRGLARRLVARGWRCVLMQFRGAGAEPNRLPRWYHHGDTSDLRDLVARLHDEEPGGAIYGVGWSLGGNVLLKYLGESGNDTALTAGVASSVPFQLEPCAHRLRSGFSRIYQAHLLKALKLGLARKAARMPLGIDVRKAMASRDFFEFDDAVTAPLNGFADARDYYARCSSGGFLKQIARPTLVLHARDDPFMSAAVVPPAEALSPAVTLEVSDAGGHVGFVGAGPRGQPQFWLESRIERHLLALHA